MRKNTRKTIYITILIVFVLGLLTGCRQSPLLEQTIYSARVDKKDLDMSSKPDQMNNENKHTTSDNKNDQNGMKNNGADRVSSKESQGKSSETDPNAPGTGNGIGTDGGAINQIVSDGGIKMKVPESVANVTTVGEDTQGPHWRSTRIENRNQYTGEWNHEMFEGQGTYSWNDGDRYSGQWKADMLFGKGTYTWSEGDSYVGEWKDDMFEGEGTYTWSSGSRYTGQWKAGVKEGQGTYTWANGDEYIGGWKAGVKEGKGIYTWADGSVYIGEWKYGIREGQGEYKGSDGTTHVGLWQNDQFVK